MATRRDGGRKRREVPAAAGLLVLVFVLAAPARAEVRSGSYAGTAATQAVAVGFAPDVVLVRRDNPDPAAGPSAVVRTATMAGTKEAYNGTPTAAAAGLVASLDPNGFTVAPDPRTNQNGFSYHWIAFKAVPGQSAVGSYTGDGTDNRQIPPVGGLGFTPAFVLVVPQGPYNPYYQSSAMPADESFSFGNSTGDTNRVQKLLADRFEVGSADEANRSGVTYHYVAWKAVPGRMAVGFYTGDGQDDKHVAGVGFRPHYVIVKLDGSNAPCHKPLATGAATDYALLFRDGYDDSNWIQALEADGFAVGDHTRVNTSGARHYWMAWGNADSGGMATTPAGQKLTVETSEVKMVWDAAKGGGLHELYAKNEGSPSTSRVGDDAAYNLFLTEVYDGAAWRRESQSAGILDVLEATGTRVRIRQSTGYAAPYDVRLERDWTVQRSPRLGIRETLVFDSAFPGLRGATGIHGRGVSGCGGGPFYCAGASNPPPPVAGSRVLLVADDGPTYSDMLAVPYSSPFFGRDGSPVSWTDAYEAGSPSTYFARVLEQTAVPVAADTKDTRFYLLYPHVEGLTSTGTEWQPYADDYRSPAALAITPGRGAVWQDPAENTSASDAFNEAEAAYVLDINPVGGLDFSLSGSPSLPRRRPFFKVRQWRSADPPSTLLLQGQTLVRDRDYVADVKPLSRAHFAQDLLWYSTLQDAAAVTSPDVGTGGTVTGADFPAGQGRFGDAVRFDLDGENVAVPIAGNFDPAQGAIELWYRPFYDYGSGSAADDFGLFGYRVDTDNYFYAYHQPLGGSGAGTPEQDGLVFEIASGPGTQAQVTLGAGAGFPVRWRANQWVHLRFVWRAASVGSPLLAIYVDGVLATPATSVLVFPSPGLTEPFLYVGDRHRTGFTNNANGLIDELRIYSSPAAPLPLANGGLYGATEYLADLGNDFPLSFAAVNASRQGEYLFVGADSRFRGLNVALATAGGGAVDLQWQYWNGSAWADLESGLGFTDQTGSLTKAGAVFWTADPPGWSPFSVNGGPELYYVRAHLGSGTYSPVPVERTIKTDILLLQHGGDVTASGQRFVVASAGATTSYRSIGSAGPASAGTVTATLGSTIVTGNATAWRAANRGRGDAITIAGVPYTVYAVVSDTELELTTPYGEASGAGKTYTIARQFATLGAWQACISGGGGCGPFPVASNSLVADNRNEVGVAYADGPFAPGLVIGGVTTDPVHTITLTADHGNRHYGRRGTATTRALVSNPGAGPAIRVQADYVTVEWLEITGGTAATATGVEVSPPGAVNRIVLHSLLIHDTPGKGIEIQSPGTVADVYNNVVYEARVGIHAAASPSSAGRIRLLANTVFGCNQNPGPSGIVSAAGASGTVLLRNNIAHGNFQGDFSVPSPTRDPASSHNLGSDGSGLTHSSTGGVDVAAGAAGSLFVSVVAGSEDLHIKPGSPADNAGVNLSALFTRDVDAGVRPTSASWDIGADELPAMATDLAIAKTDGQTVRVPGSPAFDYAISVTNNGPNAVVELRMADAMPPGFVSAGWLGASMGIYTPATETWSFGGDPLDPGDTATIWLRGTIDPYARGTLVNTATVQPPPDVTDPVPQNDVATDADALDPQVNLTLAKTDSPDPASVGERLTYTLEVRNLGLSGATGVVLTDTLPPEMRFDGATPTQGTCAFDDPTRTLTCSLGSIDPSSVATVTLVVRPRAVGTFTNQASVALNEADTDVGSNAAAQDTTVLVSANALAAFTATSTSGRNALEWRNPASDFDHAEVWFRTDGFPTVPGDGSPVFPGGAAGSGATWPPGFSADGGRVTFDHLPLSDGTTYYYAAFYYHDDLTPSLGRFCTGRPFDHTAGAVRWAFSTGATAVAPPTVGGAGVIAPSNDHLVYAMERGPTGGRWPMGWVPVALNGPVQSRSPVVPITVGAANPVVYLGAQDGAVYAIDGAKGGAAPFVWPPLPIATVVQAAPAGIFTTFGGAYDHVLVGTRNGAAHNALVAIDPTTGTETAPRFDNGGGTSGIGIVNGAAAVDYATRRVYFASRRSTIGGSASTLWCLEMTGSSPPLVLDWERDLDDVDSSPVLRNGRVYVGSAADGGTVYSIDALNGDVDALNRKYVHGDGQVKGFVFPDRSSPTGDVYFATDNWVWGLRDEAGGMSESPPFGTGISLGPGVRPSPVLFVPGSHYLYVGGSDGKLHEIDTLDGSVTSATLGDGLATVGAPSLDRGYDLVHVGSAAGIFYAVQVPLP
jgi:uncharacterized repeat protein (TIGR01451 family)